MAATHPIPGEADLEQAIATLWHEFDDAVALMMLIVDMFDEAQQTGRPINVPGLRKALGGRMRKAIAARDEVLAAVGVDPPA
jgi:hypothetical protein